ncbi:MAG: two-component system sensor histidine kinase CiaH [Candidatus Saccharimonadales bacterium]|jgi:two-component system sensor histidine kinase CiaH
MPKPNIFHSTSIKLTTVYLLIIMFISLIFSVVLYNISSTELERSVHRRTGEVGKILKLRNPDLVDDLLTEQEEAISEGKNRIKANLIIVNALILVFGGVLSYYLARMSLKPIEEAHESQSRFTADASHELRTPITAMRVETELSLSDKKLTLPKARKQLVSNIEELDKLTILSESLLKLARLDNNGLEKDNVSCAHVIEQAIDRVLKKAEQKKQIISTKNLSDVDMTVNQQSIVEALVTILDNAVKYSPEKSEIKVRTETSKKSIAILISDKGIGIRASELPHIFERFYRADSSRTQSSEHGYGIGLSIAKSVAEAHGGTIEVSSAQKKGTTFIFTLPL